MKNAIVGYIDGYEETQITNWLQSLEATNFSGDKFMILGNESNDVANWLQSRGVRIVSQGQQQDMHRVPPGSHAPVVQRFKVMAQLFDPRRNIFPPDTYDWVIHTDVRDVFFQRDPSEFLTNIDPGDAGVIMVGSENVTYANETWGRENIITSYPSDTLWDMAQHWEIYNAGTFAISQKIASDFFFAVYLLSLNSKIYNPDQAAFNILTHTWPWSDYVVVCNHNIPWACQCGTTMDPNKKFPQIVKEKPRIQDGLVICRMANGREEPYVIVHQYDRVPELKELFK